MYEHVPGWGKLPKDWEWNHAVGVAVDSKDRIYVYNRSDHPMMVFDTVGNLIASWGEGVFKTAHHIFIGPDDSLYTTDIGDHTVRKWTSASLTRNRHSEERCRRYCAMGFPTIGIRWISPASSLLSTERLPCTE